MKTLLIITLLTLAGCASMPPQAITQKDGVYHHLDYGYRFSLPPGYQLVTPNRLNMLGSMAFDIHRNKGIVAYNYQRGTMLVATANAPGDAPHIQQGLYEIFKYNKSLDDYLTNKINELAKSQVAQILDSELFSLHEYSCLRAQAKGVGVETFIMAGFLPPSNENIEGQPTHSLFVFVSPRSEMKQTENDFKEFISNLKA